MSDADQFESECRGCGNQGVLMDGHFCSHCLGIVGREVRVALEDTVVPINCVWASGVNKDGRLQIEVELDGRE